MPVELPVRIHATTIAMEGAAAVIRGASGAGKSDLALRCLMRAPNHLVTSTVELVSDDYTEVFSDNGTVCARAPEGIAGLLEIRGLGLMEIQACKHARITLIVDLCPPGTIERLPVQSNTVELAGHEFPAIRLSATIASATEKLLIALDYVRRNGKLPCAE